MRSKIEELQIQLSAVEKDKARLEGQLSVHEKDI